MARRPSRASQHQRSRDRKKQKKSPVAGIIIAVVALAVVGAAVWFFTRDNGYKFSRAHLDKYVEATHDTPILGEGFSVYLDMSDGMNSAYETPESKAILQAVINKLAGSESTKFFGLADEQISPIEMSHTELYNYMLNPASYDKQKAPIEKTLEKIVAANQPALLMTDFEEYNNGVIQKAAYAKKYFIEWLEKGNTITFYKWDFVESGKNKHMFLAVFDDNAERLNSRINNAVTTVNQSVATFVLGGRDFAFPICSKYPSMTQGGTYHNSKGQDIVSSVLESGGSEDYVSYSKTVADAQGTPGYFAPLDNLASAHAEYYPFGVTWENIISNAGRQKEQGVPEEDLFEHLFSKLYVDFGAQNGYDISGIEVRVFDMQATMQAVADSVTEPKKLAEIENPEVVEMLTAGMVDSKELGVGWKEIFMDFDKKFTSKFVSASATDLFRANIVISQASANLQAAESFFGWEGNPSLADSVKETLTDGKCSPVGRILYSYYMRTLAE